MQVVWVLIFLTISTLVGGSTNDTIVYLWPLPESVSYGSQLLSLSKSFKFSTDGGKYLDSSGILKDGVSRMFDDITLQHNMVGSNIWNGSYILDGLRVTISSTEDKVCNLLSDYFTIPSSHIEYWLGCGGSVDAVKLRHR